MSATSQIDEAIDRIKEARKDLKVLRDAEPNYSQLLVQLEKLDDQLFEALARLE